MQAELVGDTLTVATIVLPTGDVAVPVSFGWHPYLRLPGVPRSEWRVELPVRTRALLDERGLPTGETEPVEIEPGPLGERTYDDLFVDARPARTSSPSRAAAGGSSSSWGRATRSRRSTPPSESSRSPTSASSR